MTEVTDKPDTHWLDPPKWWRKAKPLRWILLLAAALWLAQIFGLMRFVKLPSGLLPSFLQAEPHPETALYTRVAVGVPMAGPFKSYQDLRSATDALTADGYEGWTHTRRRAAESSSYPPYAFDLVEVSEYKHLGSKGRLSLQFFNNRLFQAEFVPADALEYSRRLRGLGLKRGVNARQEKIEGDLRVASTVELAVSAVGQQLQTEPFVLWQDLRLIRERDNWDAKFGVIPKQMIQG